MVRSEQHAISVISQCAATCTAVVVASNIDDDGWKRCGKETVTLWCQC